MTDDSPFKFTMPDAEADLVRASYKEAGVIMEYGSGGSTLIAAEGATGSVVSVESDRNWSLRMEAWFTANPPRVPVRMHHVDVGPTGKWGFPSDKSKMKNWAAYPVSVWDRKDFAHPDVVLVDGRFRLACMLTTLLRITRPILLLCDDYMERSSYHRFEKLAGKPQMTGRMAAFTLTPQSFPVAHMAWIMPAFSDPV